LNRTACCAWTRDAWFYFDVRDADKLDLDDEGLEFASTHEARVEASRALAEMVKDAMPNGLHKAMAI
jgi:hypothetical protein